MDRVTMKDPAPAGHAHDDVVDSEQRFREAYDEHVARSGGVRAAAGVVMPPCHWPS